MNYYNECVNWLRSYNDLLEAKKNLEFNINNISDIQTEIKGISYSDMPTGNGTNFNDKYVNNVFVKDKLKSELVATEKAINAIEIVLKNFEKTDKTLCIVAKEMIINNKDAIKVSEELNYSERYIYILRNKAIKKLGVQLFGISAV